MSKTIAILRPVSHLKSCNMRFKSFKNKNKVSHQVIKTVLAKMMIGVPRRTNNLQTSCNHFSRVSIDTINSIVEYILENESLPQEEPVNSNKNVNTATATTDGELGEQLESDMDASTPVETGLFIHTKRKSSGLTWFVSSDSFWGHSCLSDLWDWRTGNLQLQCKTCCDTRKVRRNNPNTEWED